MTTLFTDSDRRCPRDGKKMLVEIGQRDYVGDDTVGLVEMVHQCWSCGYTERDDQWKRPRLNTGPTLAERLRKQRLEGVEIPYRTDIPAAEPSIWEAADA